MINSCPFSGEIYLSLGVSLSNPICEKSLCFTFSYLWINLPWTSWDFIILLAILSPMKSPVASAVFWIALFEIVLSASIADFLA